MPKFEKESLDRIKRLISRKELSYRWGVCPETLKRRQREGLLHPIRFNARLIRYSLEEILAIERDAAAAKGEPGIKPTFVPTRKRFPEAQKEPSEAERQRREKLARNRNRKPALPPTEKKNGSIKKGPVAAETELERSSQKFVHKPHPQVGFH